MILLRSGNAASRYERERDKGGERDDGGHFNVMLYALGAAVGSKSNFEKASAAHLDFEFGSFSTRDYLFS